MNPMPPTVPVDAIEALDIRYGTVTEVTISPTGKTRYQMTLDYSGAVPQAMSHGKFTHYPSGQLQGRQAATIINLPRMEMKDNKGRAIFSDAFVIGAKSSKGQAILLQFCFGIPAGGAIKVVGRPMVDQTKPQTEITTFKNLALRVGRFATLREDRRWGELDFGPELGRKVVAGPFDAVRHQVLGELVVAVYNVVPWESEWGLSDVALLGTSWMPGEIALLQPLWIPDGDDVSAGSTIY